jgi:hypothetical protein
VAMAWQFFQYVITEKRTEGTSQYPVAGPDPTPAKVLRHSAPHGRRTVRWVAATRGEWPEAPAVASFGANFRALESELNFHSPIFCNPPDDYLFIAWGVYVYAMLTARPADVGFTVGGLPASIANLGAAGKLFPATKFQRFLDTGSLY